MNSLQGLSFNIKYFQTSVDMKLCDQVFSHMCVSSPLCSRPTHNSFFIFQSNQKEFCESKETTPFNCDHDSLKNLAKAATDQSQLPAPLECRSPPPVHQNPEESGLHRLKTEGTWKGWLRGSGCLFGTWKHAYSLQCSSWPISPCVTTWRDLRWEERSF